MPKLFGKTKLPSLGTFNKDMKVPKNPLKIGKATFSLPKKKGRKKKSII